MGKIRMLGFDLNGTVFINNRPSEEKRRYWELIRREKWEPLHLPKEWEDLKAYEDSKQGIEMLRTQFHVITFSNIPIELQAIWCQRNEIGFDDKIDLSLIKCYKPNPMAYKFLRDVAIASPWHCEPEEVVVVTANASFGDLEGARYAGMNAELIRGDSGMNLVQFANQMLGDH